MATKKTTKEAATKKTPKAAASSKPPRAGRKSAQTQVFDGRRPSRRARKRSSRDDAGPGGRAHEHGRGDEGHICPEEFDAAEPSFHVVPEEDDDDDDDDSDDEPEEVHSHEKRTRYLKCELTNADREEKRGRREELDQQVEDLDAKIATADSEVKSLKKRRDGLESEGKALSKCIRDGYENRNVPCEERSAPNEDGTPGIATVRLDTLERIEWRELTAAERQGRLW